MNLQDAAIKLEAHIEAENPTAQYAAYEAVFILDGEGAELSDRTDDIEVENGDGRLYYVVPEHEGDEVLAIHERWTGSLVVYVGTLDQITSDINAAYCELKSMHQCLHCGAFNDDQDGLQECGDCGKHTTSSLPVFDGDIKGFTEYEDGDYHHLFVCDELIPTHETKSRQTFLFLRIEYTDSWGDDCKFKYHGSLCAVNPSMAGKARRKSICESYGMDESEFPKDRLDQAAMLLGNGIYAVLFQCIGNAKAEVVNKLMAEVPAIQMLAGFYIDKPQNAIGSTGWDFMKGDILAGIKRHR